MRHFRPEGVPEMSGDTRDRLIVELRRKGWSYAQIGVKVGMSRTSVGYALARIAEGRPGRATQP